MAADFRILFCRCAGAQVLSETAKTVALERLRAAEREFEAVDDLCRRCARRDPALLRWIAAGPIKIAACHPRAVQWLLVAAGAAVSPDAIEVVNLRTDAPDAAVERLLAPTLAPNTPAPAPGGKPPRPAPPPPAEEDAWPAWFPVIDYDRCTHCLQCLGFCLFGVFGVDERQRIRVVAAESCKPHCPACSRVCPEAAIIFPKHPSGPINGDNAGEAVSRGEPMKVDISALLGGDVYSRLRQRSERARARFSRERDADLALQERLRCLRQLPGSLEIPPEVLMSLPGPEEIQRRAREAAARAAAARKERADSDAPVSPAE